MAQIYIWIDSLSAFYQGMLGTAVFSISSWFVQKIYKKAKSRGSAFMTEYSKLDVHKHVLHKEYVRSGNIQYSSFGASIAMLLAARWVMLGVLIMVFFFGVNSIIQGNWIYVASAWFTFNCMLEARNWLKDSSDPKHISHVPEDIVNGIYSALKPQQPEKVKSENKTTDNHLNK